MQAKRFILLAGFGAVFLLAPPASAAQAVGGSWVQHYQFDGSDHEDELGHAVGRCGDLNGDGHADILVGAPEARNGALLRAGAVFVYSGLDGSLMFEFRGPAADMGLGHGVSGDGDVNNDGTPDIVAGAPHANTVNGLGSGAAFVVCHSQSFFWATQISLSVGLRREQMRQLIFTPSRAQCLEPLTDLLHPFAG